MNNTRITELMKDIKYYAQKYYEGEAEISDEAFDALVEELKALDPTAPILNTTGWGFVPSGTKVSHKYGGMFSIDRKPRSLDGIPKEFEYVRFSPKYDGLSCATYFKEGVFVQAITRGNGEVGLDKTDKVFRILSRDPYIHKNSKELSIDDELFTGAVRGELIMSIKDYERYKKDHPNSNKSIRNIVSGIINRKEVDSEVDYLTFVPYKIIADEGRDTDTAYIRHISEWLSDNFRYAADSQFGYVDLIKQEQLENMFADYNKEYPCDGVVITADVVLKQAIDNYKSFYYDEVAYKFNGEIKESTVIDISWNYTKNGRIVPTVLIEPIDLSGATIRRCSGFNAKFIKDKGIGAGARITVCRSGEVIPDIQNVVKAVTATLPTICPCCGYKLEFKGVDLVCVNKNCGGQDKADLSTWIFTLGSVHGLGSSIVDGFLEDFKISNIEDIYQEKYQYQLYHVSRSATHSKLNEMWTKLHNGDIYPASAFVALNIPRLGWKSAEKLCEDKELIKRIIKECKNDCVDLSTETQMRITSLVGQATFNSIMNNLKKLSRLRFIEDRIVFEEVKEEKIESKGSVVITGKLNTCKRADFEKIIIDAGYTLAPAINKDVLYLITNTPDSGSSKNKKADELGIKKITENEFLEMIKDEK